MDNTKFMLKNKKLIWYLILISFNRYLRVDFKKINFIKKWICKTKVINILRFKIKMGRDGERERREERESVMGERERESREKGVCIL